MTTHGAQIDWSAVRQKLQAGQQALERTMAMDPGRLEALFQERARRLMERHLDKEADVAATTVLVFAEGREKYAIDLEEIAEVLPLPPCTPLPESAPEVLGLVNLRGEFLTVLGLDRVLGVDREKDAAVAAFVLVLRANDSRLGLRVDAVDRIQSLRMDDLSPPPRGDNRSMDAGAAHIKGIAPDEALVVIDGRAIVARFVDTGVS